MPRDIPVGNGKLLLCFDRNYTIRDLFFPHVGQENHVGGRSCRFGLWVGGRFSWVGPEWRRDLRYVARTLVTEVSLFHKEMGILLVCRDAVDFHENIYLREISVENLEPAKREIRLFFGQDFNISGNSVGDTAAYDPETGGIVHYKGARYFLSGGSTDGGGELFQFAAGQKEVAGREGTWRDAEDGLLSGNPISQGSVDSVISLNLSVDGLSKGAAYYWIAAGENWDDIRRLYRLIRHKHPASLIQRTSDYWSLWVRTERPPLDAFSEKTAELYERSLLILKTQVDWQGGIIAANDSDGIQFNRDTYCYVWPRDGALAANALDLAGYPAPARDFYRFAADRMEKEGYLLHKFNPDGTLASSWHPWYRDGEPQLPIQEDETALVVWALWQHFVLYRDVEFIKPLYRPLIKQAADFMCGYRDDETGLPRESYDLWEERRGVPGFTVGAVFGGLVAASLFCTVFGEEGKADHYRKVASEVRDGASLHLWLPELNRFARMIRRDGAGGLKADTVCDASLWGLFAFGLYTAGDERVAATFSALRDRLWIKTTVGGMARYEDDGYHRDHPELTGNPWFVCTLWLADYLTEKAEKEEEMAEALKMLDWAAEKALPSGVLAEQIHPLTGEPLSISPLTWSHATFVASVQRALRRLAKFRVCPECGLSLLTRPGEDWIDRLYGEACDAIHGACRIR